MRLYMVKNLLLGPFCHRKILSDDVSFNWIELDMLGWFCSLWQNDVKGQGHDQNKYNQKAEAYTWLVTGQILCTDSYSVQF